MNTPSTAALRIDNPYRSSGPECEPNVIVDKFVNCLGDLKRASAGRNDWSEWVVAPYEDVNRDYPGVAFAIDILDDAVEHLLVALKYIDNPTPLVSEFSKLVDIWQLCLATSPMDRIASAFQELRSTLVNFLNCTSLKTTFEFVRTSSSLAERGESGGEHGFFWNIQENYPYESDESEYYTSSSSDEGSN